MSGLEILWLQCKWFLNKNKSYAKHTELLSENKLLTKCMKAGKKPVQRIRVSISSQNHTEISNANNIWCVSTKHIHNEGFRKVVDDFILLRNFSKLVKPAHNAKPHRDLTAVECFTTSLMCIQQMHIKWMNEWNEFLHILFLENAIKSLLNCKQSCN